MVFGGFFRQLGSDLGGGLDLLSAGFQKPLETASSLITGDFARVKDIVAETKERELKEQVTSTVITTGLGALALTTPLGKTALIPKSLLGLGGRVIGLGAVTSSPTIAGLVEPTENIKKLFGSGQTVGGIVEGTVDPENVFSTAFRDFGLLGGGAVLGAGAIVGINELLDDDSIITLPTDVEQILEPNNLDDAIPTPIGAVEVPPKETAREKQPINIDVEVNPEINVKPRKNEVFINNIVQSI